jgi:hypothetical protein
MADVLNSAPVKLDPAIVRAVTKDPELRSLRPGSAEYQAAFAKKFGESDTKKTESATVTTEKGQEAKTEVSGEGKTTTSTDENDTERSELSKKAQKRFDRITAEKKALEARIAELEAAGKTSKQAEKQAEKEQAAPSSTFDKPKPKIEDFKRIDEYTEALSDWKYDKREFERDQTTKAKTAQETSKKAYETFAEKGTKLEKELGLAPGDFQIVTNDEGFKLWDTSKAAIVESEFGPQIAFEIASDDGLKEKFSKMSAVSQLTFIGKLEAKFESKKQSSSGTNTISQAKPPGKSLAKGVSGPTSGLKLNPKDFKSYEAARKEQRPDRFKR